MPTHSPAASGSLVLPTLYWFQSYFSASSLANLSVNNSNRQCDGLHHMQAKREKITEALISRKKRQDEKEHTCEVVRPYPPMDHPTLASITEDSVANLDLPLKSKPKCTNSNLKTYAQSFCES